MKSSSKTLDVSIQQDATAPRYTGSQREQKKKGKWQPPFFVAVICSKKKVKWH